MIKFFGYKMKSIIVIMNIFFLISGCSNIFKPAANIYTDKALLYEARHQIDNQNYTAAITYLSQLSSTFAADNDVRMTFASAYAGACGMEFITFFGSIKNGTGTSTLFKFLMSSFTDRATTPSNCTLAEKKLKEIGATTAARLAATGKTDASIFMAILAMAKIGSYIRSKADVDGANSNGDGVVDLTFDSCLNQASGGFVSTEIDEIATGFALLIENLPSLLGASNSTVGMLSTISTVLSPICTAIGVTNCIVNDIALVPPAELKNFRFLYRNLIASADYGIGAGGNLSITTCPAGAPD